MSGLCETMEARRFIAPGIRSHLWAGFVFGGLA